MFPIRKIDKFDPWFDGGYNIAINLVELSKQPLKKEIVIDQFNLQIEKTVNLLILDTKKLANIFGFSSCSMDNMDKMVEITKNYRSLQKRNPILKNQQKIKFLERLANLINKMDLNFSMLTGAYGLIFYTYDKHGVEKSQMDLVKMLSYKEDEEAIKKYLFNFAEIHPTVVPFVSKNGIFGLNTYLYLVFNGLDPVAVPTDYGPYSVHDGLYQNSFGVFYHDLIHSLAVNSYNKNVVYFLKQVWQDQIIKIIDISIFKGYVIVIFNIIHEFLFTKYDITANIESISLDKNYFLTQDRYKDFLRLLDQNEKWGPQNYDNSDVFSYLCNVMKDIFLDLHKLAHLTK